MKGRPSKYDDETITKVYAYAEGCYDELPTIEGLALYLNVTKATLYDWASQENKQDFSYALDRIRLLQAQELIQKGLKGDYNAPITKMMLCNHGYSDKTEEKQQERPITVNIIKPDGA